MKRTTLLTFAAALVMTACDSTTEPAAPGDPVFANAANEFFELPPTPLPDPCTGEVVIVSGKIHGVINTSVDPLGNTTFFLHVNSAAFKGEGATILTGEPTGTRYRGHIISNTRLVLDPLDGGFVTRDQTTIRLIRKGETDPTLEDDLVIRARLFLKDGTVQFLDVEAECAAVDVDA